MSSKQSPLYLGTPVFGHSSPAPLLHLRAKGRRLRRLRSETLACGRVSSPNGTRCAGLPFGAAWGGSLLIQLEDGHECFGGQLHRTQGPHFLFASSPAKGFAGAPKGDRNARAEVNSALRNSPLRSEFTAHSAAPPCGAPGRQKKMLCLTPHPV